MRRTTFSVYICHPSSRWQVFKFASARAAHRRAREHRPGASARDLTIWYSIPSSPRAGSVSIHLDEINSAYMHRGRSNLDDLSASGKPARIEPNKGLGHKQAASLSYESCCDDRATGSCELNRSMLSLGIMKTISRPS